MGRFEMWTKVLCWDRKWFYVVTFFVEGGAVRPKGWTLQPWRNRNGPEDGAEAKVEREGKKEGEGEGEKRKGTHPAIFATGIAKYVCKRGRMSIAPERILQASGLLPPKPAGQNATPPITTSTDSPAPGAVVEGDEVPIGVASAAKVRDMTSSAAEDLIDAALNVNATEDVGGWDWDRVERERQKGLRIAEAWGKTEELGEGFMGEDGMALGRYWDWF